MNGPGKKVVGLAWCGVYAMPRSQYKLGWVMPGMVAHHQRENLTSDQRKALGLIPNRQFARSDMYRVRITIEPVKDRRGKYIVRRAVKAKRRRSSTK